MAEFGVACNIGSGAFCITMVPAIAFLINEGGHNSKNNTPEQSLEKRENKYLLKNKKEKKKK